MIEIIPDEDTMQPGVSKRWVVNATRVAGETSLSFIIRGCIIWRTIGPRKLESKTVKRSKVSKEKRKSLKEDRHRKEKQKGRK